MAEKQKLVVVGNGMAGARFVEEVLSLELISEVVEIRKGRR